MSKEAIIIVREEFRNPPELRVAKRLFALGLTSVNALSLNVPDGIRCAVYNAMRDIEQNGKYKAVNCNDMWIYFNEV